MVGVLVYGSLYIFIHACIKLRWWRWHVEGRELLPPRESGGMIVVMNHIHWLDIPAVGAMLPFKYRLSWLAKAEIFSGPIARWFFRSMQTIPIQRGKRDLAALDASVEAVNDGAVLLIYPEGTRSRSGMLRQGRGGAIRIAMQSGVPIVPIAITGTEHGLKGTLLRKPVTVRIGEPYTVAALPQEKIPPDVMEQLTTDMMLRIARLLPAEYRGHYRELAADSSSAD